MAVPFTIVRLDEFPASPAANAMYIVRDQQDSEKVNLVFTGEDAQIRASVITIEDVKQISSTVIAQVLNDNNVVRVFSNYQEMINSTPEFVTFAYTKDTTGDETTNGRPACYIYEPNIQIWELVSSSSDTVDWSNIIGRPEATPEQIDTAVLMTHGHDNLAVLNKITETPQGQLAFNNEPVSTVVFTAAEW